MPAPPRSRTEPDRDGLSGSRADTDARTETEPARADTEEEGLRPEAAAEKEPLDRAEASGEPAAVAERRANLDIRDALPTGKRRGGGENRG
jgi:hypothetical protein